MRMLSVRGAQMLLRGDHPTLACKSVRVSDFGGKSLGTLGSTNFEINPDIPEAGNLRSWCAHALAARGLRVRMHALTHAWQVRRRRRRGAIHLAGHGRHGRRRRRRAAGPVRHVCADQGGDGGRLPRRDVGPGTCLASMRAASA
jgi:hypothetical protein